VGRGLRVALLDGAVDGDSYGDHEGAGHPVPVGIAGGEDGGPGHCVRGDGVEPGLHPPSVEAGAEASRLA